jgi:hypothetical protein
MTFFGVWLRTWGITMGFERGGNVLALWIGGLIVGGIVIFVELGVMGEKTELWAVLTVDVGERGEKAGERIVFGLLGSEGDDIKDS